MKYSKLALVLATCSIAVACVSQSDSIQDNIQNNIQNNNQVSADTSSKTISFLAFGDGGYSVDYPKHKDMLQGLNKAAFIAKERAEWLEEHRPIAQFGHPPIHVYADSNIATEKSGAMPVGQAMAKLCAQKPCEFAIQLGDNIYPDGADANDGKDDQKRMDDLILGPLKPLFDQEPDLVVYSALGNHDWNSSRKGIKLQTEWMAKQQNFHMGEQGYYSFTMGEPGNDIEFFAIDTNMLLSGQRFYEIPLNPDGTEADLETALESGIAELEDFEPHEGPVNGEDKTQLAWLQQGLKNSKAKWKMVYGHHILWSVGGTKYDEGHVLRRLIMPTLCQYADAYIAGHEHDLELLTDDCSAYPESNSKAPLPLIISGAASKMRGIHTPFAKQQEIKYPQMRLLFTRSLIWGFAHIEVKPDVFDVEYYTTPNEGSGELVAERTFRFVNRTD